MKVGVLGVGGMGSGVIAQLQESERVTGIVAYDVREARVRDVQAQQAVEATTDLQTVLDDAAVRLVFVAASNSAHKDLTVRALNAGKAVLCEKPMATTLADCREMVDTAERLGAFLQIGFELRYSKLYAKVKEWIDAGLLGQVINTHCYYVGSGGHKKGSWRKSKEICGSMFGEKLSHYVDVPRWWVGTDVPVIDVFSVCSPNVVPGSEVHDNYHTTYRFANGAVSHLTFVSGVGATFRGDHTTNIIDQQQGDGHALRYLAVGTRGVAEASVFNRSIKRWEFGTTNDGMTSTWVEDLTWDGSDDHAHFHNTHDQTLDIVRRVAEGLPPKTPARDAYESMRLCFAAEQSADTGGLVRLDAIEA